MLPLTKAGNKRVKALFCESAKAIKRTNPYGQKSKRILERQKNASPESVAYADKTTKRIRTKMSMDHSKAFYSEVLRIFPDYKRCDKWLKQNGRAYFKRIENAEKYNK